jgi:putative endonuclease
VSWFLYVVECNAHGKPLYTGISKDVAKRVETHNAGKGAKYVKGKLPVVLVATWEYPDKSTALKAEYAFKEVSRLVKQIFIQSPELWDFKNPKLEKRCAAAASALSARTGTRPREACTRGSA